MSEPIPADPVDPDRGTSLGPVTAGLVQGTLVVVALVSISAWLFLALSHLQDRYGVLHVQGAWMGLARYANEGVLYPPLFDGVRYGGTRWMPLPILLHATAARITGEYLVSGKLVGLLLTSGLLLLVFVGLRRFGTTKALAGALTGTIVATDPGRLAGTTLGGDVLPVVLQVGAVMIATTIRSRYALAGGGVLAGLAITSKSTGAWAALAIITWLAIRRRWRDLGGFTLAVGVTIILVLGVVELISEGRFSDSLLTLSFAGVGGGVGPVRAPNQLLYQLANFGLAVWILIPFAVLGALTVHRPDRISVYHLALGWALVSLLVVYTDVGAGGNQLLDVTVLTVLAVGHLAGRHAASPLRAATVVLLSLAVIWGTTTGVVLTLVPDIRTTIEGAPLGYPMEPLADRVGPTEQLLSEDPYVPLSLDRDPVVLDPFMLSRLDRVDPAAVDELIERIERQEFTYIVTIQPLNPDDGVASATAEDEAATNYWWDQFHFGLRVVDAMRRAYEFEGIVDEYYLYRPVT